jgi:hypothetical protein
MVFMLCGSLFQQVYEKGVGKFDEMFTNFRHAHTNVGGT